MHPDLEIARRINNAQYLYLRKIEEPRDNQLELRVQEAGVNEAKRGTIQEGGALEEIQKLLTDTAPIESTPDCLAFRLFWRNYVAYLVTEECAGSCGNYEDEIYSGNLFRLYSKSHFLEHLARDTGAHCNPLIHYKLCCLNHIIDVAAEEPPEIEIIRILEAEP